MVAPPASPGVRTRRAAAAEEASSAAKAPAAAPAKAPPAKNADAADGDASGDAGPFLLPPLLPLARFAARCLLLAWLACVWLWHLTPRASVLPGATGYFWFCRYLTFYSFTLQLVATALAAAHEGAGHWREGPRRRRRRPRHQGEGLQQQPPQQQQQGRARAQAPADDAEVERVGRAAAAAAGGAASALARWADDLGCAVFCFGHVVTLMFHIIQRATGGKAVEGAHLDRPFWLDASVHRLNTLAVWVDVAVLSQRGARSFSRSGEKLSIFLVTVYCAVLASSKWLNGAFPYPFMNAMRQPRGFLVVCGGGVVIFGGAFRLGRAVARGLRAAEDFFFLEEEEDKGAGTGAAAVVLAEKEEAAVVLAKEGAAPRAKGKGGGGGNPLARAARFLLRRPSSLAQKTKKK